MSAELIHALTDGEDTLEVRDECDVSDAKGPTLLLEVGHLVVYANYRQVNGLYNALGAWLADRFAEARRKGTD